MKNKFVLFLACTILLVSLVSAHTGEDEAAHHEGCGMMTGVYGFGGMFFGWIFSILVIVALVLLIVWLIKQIQGK